MICHTPEQVVDAATALVKAYDARVEAEGDPILEHYATLTLTQAIEDLKSALDPAYVQKDVFGLDEEEPIH